MNNKQAKYWHTDEDGQNTPLPDELGELLMSPGGFDILEAEITKEIDEEILRELKKTADESCPPSNCVQ